MLRCRKCRKGVIDSTCLTPRVEAADGDSAAVCSIWHVDVDTMPDWILGAVHQAQWTLGKLNCPSCGARLGGFNFVHGGECPCGRDTAIHLSKSRVDHDHKHYVLIVQPRRTRPSPPIDRMPDLNGMAPLNPGLQLDCAAVVSHVGPGQTSKSLSSGGDSPSFSFSPLNCISHKRRCSLDDDAIRASCFCRGVVSGKSSAEMVRTDVSVPCPTERQRDVDEGPTGRSRVSEDRGSAADLAHEDSDPSVLNPWIHEEILDPGLILRDRNGEDSEDEQDDDQTVFPPVRQTLSTSNRLNKREKNRLKSLQRKQRRRERWLHRQLEQEQGDGVNVSLQDADDADREGMTCAVCLDVYFSPYTCRPCDHVFCEPCLRTLAKNRHANTPCPLCRTVITHTSFNKELHHAAKTFFPKVYVSRKQNFQNAPCSKWPLPSGHKRFRNLWGSQRRAAAGERWRLTRSVFMLDALDLTDMRGWLFDIALVIVYVHSVNWILAVLLFGFLTYYFLC